MYCPDKYKTQKNFHEIVDNCLSALKFISDWFATNKMLEKFDNVLHANDNMLFYNEELDKVTFIGGLS